jgi:uncharacterized protein YjbI with pentapeptide repeats
LTATGEEVVANEEHVKILKQGVEVWHAWRHANDVLRPDLSRANLHVARLNNFSLNEANLRGAHLRSADLCDAQLLKTDLTSADLSGADLSRAELHHVILQHSNLRGADLTEAQLGSAIFPDVDLANVIGLDTCIHDGPSTIDHRTLQKSGPLPLKFFRCVGLPDLFIDYLPSLLNQAIQHYSCFISYSTLDHEFAKRLHADLQDKGVRCWFAPHGLRIGAKTWDAIDEAIKLRDRLLLILSKNSIKSDWVEMRCRRPLRKKRERKQPILFPVRIDDAVLKTPEPWARKP